MAKSRIFIIAGPQSSGKTTAWMMLREREPDWKFIEEMNPYLLKGKSHRGGAFVTPELEREISERDINLISTLPVGANTYAIETGIFHLVYLERYCGRETAGRYMSRYLEAYLRLSPVIIFIDTEPQISWERRKSVYEQRLSDARVTDPAEREKALKKYRDFIEVMYPLWLSYYKQFPFTKFSIANSHSDAARFNKEVTALIRSFARRIP